MTWTDARFGEIAAFLTASTGLTFPAIRRPYAESGVRRTMKKLHVRDLDSFSIRLRAEAELLSVLVAEITVGETYFFRDPAQLEVLRTRVLPEIVRGSPAADIRLWSAGCASGEEAYSLAMLVEEVGLPDRASIYATDISATAIEKARKGAFSARSFRSELPPWRVRSFEVKGNIRHVLPRHRARIVFAVHNLAQMHWNLVEPASFDLVLCRNVLMYFDRNTVELVAQRFVQALKPGGWLVTSTGDPPLPGGIGLEIVATAAGLLYRKLSEPVQARPPEEAQALMPMPWQNASNGPLPRDVGLVPLEGDGRSRIRALMRSGALAEALRESVDASTLHPLDAGLHELRALLLLDLGRPAEAAVIARRALFLDRSRPLAHLAFGRALRLIGRYEDSRRALRHVHELVALGPPTKSDGPSVQAGVSDDISADSLAAGARAELVLLEREMESVP